MRTNRDKHSAGHSATGYLYQCRYALMAALRAIVDSQNSTISIEKFDDIAIENDDQPVELIQTKHHIASRGSLSDASIDLWKTLGIWASRTAENPDFPFRTRLVLLTTGVAPAGSAASLLRPDNRDEDQAHSQLLTTATSSTNRQCANFHRAFCSLPSAG